ncbi:hypothetical protein HS088_TW15G00367 [Tripterygium wilfordii]|uniref:DHHC-type zinc finger family protein n=1 Tax=Tripterygium wilfordii TaxID=458696 RepID=A0A7J7CLC9_TRIWF|nr:hypothetical protein HS088_TW15G00367 [Tripterygium wilfordii]
MNKSSGGVMAWNVFKFCTPLRALGSFMILVVLAIIGVTYYSVVIVNYGPALFHGGRDTVVSLAVLLLFHFLLAMLLWSYFSVVLTDPGGVPRNWMPLIDEERGDTDPLVSAQDGLLGIDSNQFSLPGDAANQKISDGEIPGTAGTLAATFISFVLNLSFALSLLGFLIVHMMLVVSNTTTIEAYEKKTTSKWYYDLGWKKNFEQVFGREKRYWLIPSYSEDDLQQMPALRGFEYPTRPDLDELQQL